MKILTIYPGNINERHITEAVETLRDGGLVAYPTDSVYGIAADALNKKAVERLCRLKGLDPEKHLLAIVCSDLSQASEYVRIDNNAFSILRAHLPGAYTFILPSSTRLPKIFKSRRTIGLRIPDNAIARELASRLGNPMLTSSVDIDTDNPEASAEPENIALTYDNNVDLVIDGGTGGTVSSTLVDITDPTDPQVLRQGIADFDL